MAKVIKRSFKLLPDGSVELKEEVELEVNSDSPKTKRKKSTRNNKKKLPQVQ